MKAVDIDLNYYLDPDFKNLDEVIDLPFGIGKSFNGFFPDDVTVIVKSKPPLPDFMICGAMYIVSQKLKQILEKAKGEGEFFPINIRLRNIPYTQQEFYCFNPLNEIDAIDYKNSVYSVDENDKSWVKTISKLVLDKKKITGINYFILEHTATLFVSDEITREIVEENIIGIDFIEVENFESK